MSEDNSTTAQTTPEPQTSAPTAAEAVRAALRAHPGATTVEIALAASVGRSTASKVLADLAQDGSATRTPGNQQGRQRTPDRWTLTPVTASGEPEDTTGGTDNADSNTTPPKNNAASPQNTATPEPGGSTADTKEDAPAPADNAATTQDIDIDADATATGPATVAGGKTPRLAKGELRGMIEDFLTERTGKAFTPGEIGRVLKRSSGAVANALDTLVATGYATRVSPKPKRYTKASDTEAREQTVG